MKDWIVRIVVMTVVLAVAVVAMIASGRDGTVAVH